MGSRSRPPGFQPASLGPRTARARSTASVSMRGAIAPAPPRHVTAPSRAPRRSSTISRSVRTAAAPIGKAGVRAFRVTHPPWAVRTIVSVDYAVDFAALYGPAWQFLNHARPVSTVLAVGSDVAVYPPRLTGSTNS